ncbi:hypothetical protein M8J76_002594 [Diaphorina citri]|nr:hypothetical protein M8J75_011165 [Diaphorina citri]KAI5740306.1 hypothetical protein M8J76_002594 [Diaphorina citri]
MRVHMSLSLLNILLFGLLSGTEVHEDHQTSKLVSDKSGAGQSTPRVEIVELSSSSENPQTRIVPPSDECVCPCADYSAPVCGQTTYGVLRTFQSECHLICHNQCGFDVRYAMIRKDSCPVSITPIYEGPSNSVPTPIVPITNNRRFSMLNDWACDCHYCPLSDRTKPDYYPICAEKNGVQTTFDTWCHFDCENRCYEYTKQYHIFLHRGSCIPEPHFPRFFYYYLASTTPLPLLDFTITERQELCKLCADQCRSVLIDPVCARGSSGDYLAFKSRCHLRCHNQCHYHNAYAQFYEIHEGDCKWM